MWALLSVITKIYMLCVNCNVTTLYCFQSAAAIYSTLRFCRLCYRLAWATRSLSCCTDMEPETHPHALQRVEVDRYVDPSADWQTGLWLQYSTLTRRNFWRQRGRYFSKLLFGQMLFLSVVTGVVWFNMKRTEDMARDRLGMVIIPLRSCTYYGQCWTQAWMTSSERQKCYLNFLKTFLTAGFTNTGQITGLLNSSYF